MAVVELHIPPQPAHVRIARLVGVAAAHRARLSDDLVDELRLALGEACTRAVNLHARVAPGVPVVVRVVDELGRLTVEVIDVGPPPGGFDVPVHELLHDAPDDPNVALAFLSGLVEDVEVRANGTGTSVRLSWPLLAPVH